MTKNPIFSNLDKQAKLGKPSGDASIRERWLILQDFLNDRVVGHSSLRQLAGEKKWTAIIIKQQFGFAIRTTLIQNFKKFQQELFW